jgi:hypothetical protein|tara:strand:- start:3563 stop:4129 length:567 start_codon:yes stop_codon:yes gene_type:complete
MLEEVSLSIANYWTSNGFLTESNDRCGTLIAFDWIDDYLIKINTNIDLSDLELGGFKFDTFVEFLKKNNFTFVLGLRYDKSNPTKDWTDKLKKILKSNEIEYDEYTVEKWPAPIPEFSVPDNVYIIRYSFDEYSKIDQLASNQYLFEQFMVDSNWKEYYKNIKSEVKTRVIVFCNDIENIILHNSFKK